MAFSFIRPLRRVITKKCGGYRKFLLVSGSLALIIYTLRVLFVNDGRQVWDVKSLSSNRSSPCDVKCLPDQFSFYIKTGEKSLTVSNGPIICFQGTMYMSPEQNNVNRGLNIVLVDTKSQAIKSVSVFDTYIDDSSLLRFLKKDAKDEDILLIATFDDASYGLKETARHWLTLFGSSLITQVGFRENFIMIGHRGLAKGSAIEYYMAKQSKKEDSFALPIEKAGCFSFPLGKKMSMENTVPEVLRDGAIKLGERHENCGLTEPCPVGSVSVFVDTGHGNVRKPTICVDGYIRMDSKTNDAGRGFNVVILDNETLQPSRLSHMDTYTFDSTDLELLLETLHMNEIVIAVIADDASNKLGQSARDLLNKIGSGHIQNLRFRDVWYFVGQKGIEGFTKLEQLSFAAFDGGWPKPLSSKFCIPKKVPTTQVMIDPEYNRNDDRRNFCTKYEGYIDFCDPAHVDDELKTIPVSDKYLKDHKIFDLPVIIVPGLNHNAFVHTLQTTLMQPGLKTDNVAIFWDEKLPEYGELATMFGFRNYSLAPSRTYAEQMLKALKLSRVHFPHSDFMIIIEEDLLLAPDFMPFMAECLKIISLDTSLVGAFAWNVNGFEQISGNNSQVYRVQEFPGLGFLVKSDIIQQLIETNSECCDHRAWFGWHMETQGLEMLMPDVSRVYKTPFDGAQALTDVARNLFLKPRKTFLELQPASLDISHLISTEYETFLHGQIDVSSVVLPADLLPCIQQLSSPPDMKSFQGPLVINYYQNSTDDYSLLIKLCQCFGLVTLDNYQPKNLHNGLLRFYHQEHDVFLIGTKTQYFNSLIDPKYVLKEELLLINYTFINTNKDR